MTEEGARHWPDLMRIVEAKVKPERMKQNDEGAKKYRWQFIRSRPELHGATSGLSRVLVFALHQPHRCITSVHPHQTFSHALGIVTDETPAAFAIIQNRLHEVWARFQRSSMKDDLRYTPTDCFETFPFPSAWESNPALAEVGADYYKFRAALMVRNSQGLTETYNRFHDRTERDPDIIRLRESHDAMDRAVLDAYGWTDIRPTCDFFLDYEDEEEESIGKASKRKKPWRYRWPDDIRDEVLARLLKLNAERAEQERQRGGTPTAGSRARTRKRRKTTRSLALNENLF